MYDTDIRWLYCNIGDCDWKTPAGPRDLARHRYKHHDYGKGKVVNDIDHAASYMGIPYACKKCSFVTQGMMAATRFATHKCENYKPKEKNMNDQMEQVWRSKDGAVTGSKGEVEAYLKSKNPLAKMRFPYRATPSGRVCTDNRAMSHTADWELVSLVAFANLAPLIQELLKEWEHEWRGTDWRGSVFTERWHNELANLLVAYEEALKQVPQ